MKAGSQTAQKLPLLLAIPADISSAESNPCPLHLPPALLKSPSSPLCYSFLFALQLSTNFQSVFKKLIKVSSWFFSLLSYYHPHWEGPTNQATLLNKNDFLPPPLGLCMAILPILNPSSPPGYYSTYSHPWKTWVQTCLEWPQMMLLPAAASFKLQLSLRISQSGALAYTHPALCASSQYLSPIIEVFLICRL